MSRACLSDFSLSIDQGFQFIERIGTTLVETPSNAKEDRMEGNAIAISEVTEALPATGTQERGSSAVSGSQNALAEAWSIDFSTPKLRRRTCAKERHALLEGWLRHSERKNDAGTNRSLSLQKGSQEEHSCSQKKSHISTDSEGNIAAVSTSVHALHVVNVDGLEDRNTIVPTNLHTKRADLEKRLVLRLPRLLCISKQYPRSCGITSLTSIYNYLYSCIGETAAYSHVPPVTQEEVMTILGFEPPFGEIQWGGFTGNTTLIRWFHALNRYFGRKGFGSAYILYKAHGQGKTTHMYESDEEVLDAVKKALSDPCCALIYHCYNHYMVPVGYQVIPIAQTDFYSPQVAAENCETTIFIGEVSRGKHEAMYARKWSLIKKDIECQSPYFFNIRHPEQGVQLKTAKARHHGVSATGKQQVEGENENACIQEEVTNAPILSSECNVSSQAQRDDKASTNGDAAVFAAAPPLPPVRGSLCISTQDCTNGGDVVHNPTSFAMRTGGGLEATSLKTDVGAVEDGDGPSSLRVAQTTAPSPVIASPITKKAKSKREPGNLHCLIAFRNDRMEDNLSKYELFSSDSSISLSDVSEEDRKS
ncbi:unnamed protein product [Phytomonas sp. EM1]|nr:unnamed protein product [Phytomonas sp. EM1]|eukprot:CCW61103.1 unnamed protein product [Phytomonas sp. isolate EM1]